MFLTRSLGALAGAALALLPSVASATRSAPASPPGGRLGACFENTVLASVGLGNVTEAAIDSCRGGDKIAFPIDMSTRLNIGIWCDQKTVSRHGTVVWCRVRNGARRAQGLPPLGHF